MKKTMIIAPIVKKQEFDALEKTIHTSPNNIIFCFPTYVKHPAYRILKNLKIKFQNKIYILIYDEKTTYIEMLIDAHKSFLQDKTIGYFANYEFKALSKINFLYNSIDTIVNNSNIGVVFCIKEYSTTYPFIDKMISLIFKHSLSNLNIYNHVVNKRVANFMYKNFKVRNYIIFKFIFINRLYSFFNKKIHQSIY